MKINVSFWETQIKFYVEIQMVNLKDLNESSPKIENPLF